MAGSLPKPFPNRIIARKQAPGRRRNRIAMAAKFVDGRRWFAAAAATALGTAMAFALAMPARAQQGSAPPSNLIIPGNQGSSTSTLELPSMPARQGGAPLSLPPQVAQPGQELVIPSRQLRERPGYAQVNVTVTDPSGAYVTGLQKDEFKLYLDGQQRPIEFFRSDLNTPVSIGILVDTSGA